MKGLDSMQESELGMSNLDRTIDEGLEDELKSNAGKMYAQYAGWNFCGYVWFEDEQFVCQVWTYRVPREEIVAPTLEEIMEEVSCKYRAD